MNKETIVSRVNNNKLGIKFYKSYVTGIKKVETREIPEHVCGWCEEDYMFNYKGRQYKVNQYIVPNENGIVKFSAKYRYTVEEVK